MRAALSHAFSRRQRTDRVQLIRQAAGRRNEYGEWEPGAEAAPVPADVRSEPLDLQGLAWLRDNLPEGSRLMDARLFTVPRRYGPQWAGDQSREVAPVRAGTGATDGDVIVWQGQRFRAQRVAWQRRAGGFERYDVTAVRIEGQDGKQHAPIGDFTPSRQEVERRIRAAVAEGTGLPSELVIPGDDDGPRPDSGYASVLLSSSRYLSHPQRSNIELPSTAATGDIDVSTSMLVEPTYEVVLYRDQVAERAWRLAAYLTSSEGSAALAAPPPIVVVNVSGARQDDETVAASWEQRATVMLTVSHQQDLRTRTPTAATLDIRIGLDEAGYKDEAVGPAGG